jgi:hypothetical protein
LLYPLHIKIDIIIVNNIITPAQIRAIIVRLPISPSSTLTIDLKPWIFDWTLYRIRYSIRKRTKHDTTTKQTPSFRKQAAKEISLKNNQSNISIIANINIIAKIKKP